MLKGKWEVVLGEGNFRMEKKIFAGGRKIKLTDGEFIHFYRCGLVVWSNHPEMQLKLATDKWQSERDSYAAKGGSDKYFCRKHKQPTLEEISTSILPHGEKGDY